MGSNVGSEEHDPTTSIISKPFSGIEDNSIQQRLKPDVGDEVFVKLWEIEGKKLNQEYCHAGIYIGENRVVTKYSEGFKDKETKCKGVIKCDLLDSVLWRGYNVRSKGNQDSKHKAVKFLKGYLEGKNEEFQFMLNNSEHFVQKCLSTL